MKAVPRYPSWESPRFHSTAIDFADGADNQPVVEVQQVDGEQHAQRKPDLALCHALALCAEIGGGLRPDG